MTFDLRWMGCGAGYVLAGAAAAQSCGPEWSGAFSVIGTSTPILSAQQIDLDGPGPHPPALYLGTQNGVLRWDGATLDQVGGNLPTRIGDVVGFDFDGPGPNAAQLMAVGAGPAYPPGWSYEGAWIMENGSWHDLIPRLPPAPPIPGVVFDGLRLHAALVVDFDGSGNDPSLFIAGYAQHHEEWSGFYCPTIDTYIARWDGKWELLDTDVQPIALDLVPVRNAGGAGSSMLVRSWLEWNKCLGHSSWGGWISKNALFSGTDWTVLSSCSGAEPNPPPDLCHPFAGVAQYDGEPYSAGPPTLYVNEDVVQGPFRPLTNLPVNPHHLLAADLDATGPLPELMYGAGPTVADPDVMQVLAWDGSSWSALGAGIGGAPARIGALAAFGAVPGTQMLYVAGEFAQAGSSPAKNIARWTGSVWAPLGNGMNNEVHALLRHDDGRMFAGGAFVVAGGEPAVGIAAWDGERWQGVGGGMNHHVDALAAWNGSLYAGGKFTRAGSANVNYVARWNGTAWAALGTGVNNSVNGLTAHTDAGGSALYAVGRFTSPGSGVARWNGAAWSALGSGSPNEVLAAASYAGSLYIGGKFVAVGGVPAVGIARWNGAAWSAVGGGVNNHVQALAVMDQVLYVGGKFTTAGGLPAPAIAKWNGSAWSTLGQVVTGDVKSLAAGPVGGAARMFIGGEFTIATPIGGVLAKNLAGWDGAHWVAAYRADAPVLALATGDGEVLVGGAFANLDSQSSLRVGILSCEPQACYADCNADGALNLSDFGCFQTKFALAQPYADCNGDGVRNLSDFGCFQTKFALGCP